MEKPSLMLLGGENRNALGIVRRFGQEGIRVFVGGSGRWPRSCYSRYATRRFTYPSPSEDLEGAHAVVMEYLDRFRPDVLLPAMDDEWMLVYAFFEQYEEKTAVVPCPGGRLFAAMLDKSVMTPRAEQLGLSVPRSFPISSREEGLDLADGLPYPVLLKPVRSVAGEGICLVRDPRELATALGNFDEPPLIQEYIEGEDLELTLLFQRGEPLAGSVYQSLRNYPLPYGPPIACRTIRDESLLEEGSRLLRGLHYHGVAHLDFRRDARDGIPKLLDFNARLAGTDEISARSGVDFPSMLYQLALDRPVEPRFSYETGLEFRWLLFGEIQHLFRGSGGRRSLRHLRSWRNVHTNASLRDPVPHVAHVLTFLQRRRESGA